MLEANAYGNRGFTFTARRNCSIAPRTMCVALAAVAGLALLFAGAWASLGAWLILPFAGAEAIALLASLLWHARRVGDFERISLKDDCLIVEICEMNRLTRHEFNPVWARLVLDGRDAQRLALRSHGREYAIGRHLDDEGRRRLADELKHWLPVARP